MSVAFDYEKYRTGTRAFGWTFFHGNSATNPNTAVDAGTQDYVADGANAPVSPPTSISKSFDLTGLSIATGTTYYLRWTYTGVGGGTNAQGLGIDNLTLSVPPPATPTVTVTPGTLTTSSNNFGDVTVGQFSAARNFQVSGASLTQNLIVSVPAGFQVKKNTDADGLYAVSTTMAHSGGTVSNTTINVRFAPASPGAHSGNVTSVSGSTSGTSLPVSGNGVAVAAPTKLVITSINGGNPVVAGLSFSITVQAQDAGNVAQNVAANTPIALSSLSTPGTLGGTLTGQLNAGSNTTTISGITYSQAHAGVVITATRTGGDALTPGNSAPIQVLGPATKLAFVNVPASGIVNQSLATFQVQARRANDDVATEYNGTVTLSVASGPGSLGGGTTATITNGVAGISGRSLNATGSHTLGAATGGLESATSPAINILTTPVSIWSNGIENIQPGGAQPNTQDPFTFGDVNDPHITVSGIGRGSGITGTGAGGRYNANAWNVASEAAAVSGNKFFHWTLGPHAGYTIDLAELTGNWQRSGTGPNAWALRSSLDGYAANIATGAITGDGSQVAFNIPPFSVPALDAVTSSITFRLYAWGASAAGGTFSINDFNFMGHVIPPPTALATFTQVSPGMASSPLEGGTTGHILLAFTAVSDAAASTLPTMQSLTGLVVATSNNPIPSLTNVRLVDGDDAVVGTFAITVSGFELTGINVPLGAAPGTFRVVADVVSTVTPVTPPQILSLDAAGISISGGDKTVIGGTIESIEYAFIASTLPVLSATPVPSFGEVCYLAGDELTEPVQIVGANLVGNVTVGPLDGFLFLDPSDIFGGYEEQLVLTPVGGALDAEILVLFAPYDEQDYSGVAPLVNSAVSTTMPLVGIGMNTLPALATGTAVPAHTSAQLLGSSITEEGCHGPDAVTQFGVVYSTVEDFDPESGTEVPGVYNAGTWTTELTGLEPCATYWYRAYAVTEGGGTAYGGEQSFTTLPLPAPVATVAAGVFSSGFTANWEAVPGATGYLLDVSTLPNFAVENYAADLFISEYVEGSGNNKYLEIYNGTPATVALDGVYSLRLYSNGSTTPSQAVLSGTLASGTTMVLRNSGATIYTGTTSTNSAVNFNGDDPIALAKNGVNIDVFGPLPTGSSPGNFAIDVTRRRNANVTQGSGGAAWTPAEWATFSQDNIADLGQHTSVVPSVVPSFVGGYEALPVSGTSQEVIGLTEGVTYYYRVRALYGDECVGANSNTVPTVPTCIPVVLGEVVSNAPICSIDALELSVEVLSGEGVPTFSWSGTGVFAPDDISADVEVTGAASGIYTVQVSNGCSNAQGQVTVVVTQATAWYADGDGDGLGDLLSVIEDCEQPDGYVANASDACPVLSGTNGDVCDAGPGFVLGEIEDCACVGQPCSTDLVFETVMASPGTLPTWMVRESSTGMVVVTGGGTEGDFSGHHPEGFCLPDGDFRLEVDNVPAGATYKVYGAEAPFVRIIDNTAPVQNEHQVEAFGNSGGTIQLPVSDDRVLLLACDKYWWVAGDYLVANEDAAVAAIWGNGNTAQQANTGYDFWFYDPNGTYSYVRQRRHNQADGYANVGSARTCHMRVNSSLHGWATANHIPNGLPLNVRVRTVVNGVVGAWGPACRFVRDEALAACPPTTLWRVPATDPKYSCDDATRNWSTHTNQRIYAHPVSGASQYSFRFENENEGEVVTRTVSTYYLNMGWSASVAPPLSQGSTYRVTVRANKGGGLGPENDGWCMAGDPCTIMICGPQGQNCGGGMNSGDQNSDEENTTAQQPAFSLWPNPNRGDQLNLSFSSLGSTTGTITVDILDLSGKRVNRSTIVVNEGVVNTSIDLNGSIAAGMYVVNIMAGGTMYTERLVIQP